MPSANPLHAALHATGNTVKGNPLPQKSFVEPFRLIFEKPSGEVSNIEVRSLGGLRSVAERLENGELCELNRFSTLEMQLWGLLAERVGFLRRGPPQSGLAAGIMPLGEGATGFAEDMSSLFGGEVEALNALSEMKEKARKAGELQNPKLRPDPTPSEHKFVKEDGVNLTPDGEIRLANLVGASSLDREADNAAHLMRSSDSGYSAEELDEIEEAGKVDDAIHGTPTAQTGPMAAAIGMAVEAPRPVEFPEPSAKGAVAAELEKKNFPASVAANLKPFVPTRWLLEHIYKFDQEEIKRIRSLQESVDNADLWADWVRVRLVTSTPERYTFHVDVSGVDPAEALALIERVKKNLSSLKGKKIEVNVEQMNRRIFRREGDTWVETIFPMLRKDDHFVVIDDAETTPDTATEWRATDWPKKGEDGYWMICAKEVNNDDGEGQIFGAGGSSKNPEDPA